MSYSSVALPCDAPRDSLAGISNTPVRRTLKSVRQPAVPLSAAAFVVAACAAHGFASAAPDVNFNPPDIQPTDGMGVNVISGNPMVRLVPLTIGPADRPMVLSLLFDGAATAAHESVQLKGKIVQTKYNYPFYPLYTGFDEVTVQVLGESETFSFTAGAWMARKGTGGQLVRNAVGNFEYTRRDGMRAFFDEGVKATSCPFYQGDFGMLIGICQSLRRAVFPDGLEYSFEYQSSGSSNAAYAISVTRNDGFQMRYVYGQGVFRIVGSNLAADYCDPRALTCSYTKVWPEAGFQLTLTSGDWFNGTSEQTVTGAGGEVTKLTTVAQGGYEAIVHVKASTSPLTATSSFDWGSATMCGLNGSTWGCTMLRKAVSAARQGGNTWSYQYTQIAPSAPPYTDATGLWLSQSTSPAGLTVSVEHNVRNGLTSYIASPLGRLDFESSGFNRVTSATDAAGRRFVYSYDSRGNITERRQRAGATNDDSVDIVFRAGYDSTCSAPAKCNKPNWVRDANGNQTDYIYDASHGGVLTETLPAPDPAQPSVRPQRRYAYAQRYAWVKGSSGNYERAATPIWVLTRMSFCRTGPPDGAGGCAHGSADEVVTTYEYGPDAGPNNLLRRGQVVTAVLGNGTLQSQRTCYGYDALGNKTSETTPGAGVASCP